MIFHRFFYVYQGVLTRDPPWLEISISVDVWPGRRTCCRPGRTDPLTRLTAAIASDPARIEGSRDDRCGRRCRKMVENFPWRIHGAAIYIYIYLYYIYMVCHGSHQYTPNVSIYTSTMDPMGECTLNMYKLYSHWYGMHPVFLRMSEYGIDGWEYAGNTLEEWNKLGIC